MTLRRLQWLQHAARKGSAITQGIISFTAFLAAAHVLELPTQFLAFLIGWSTLCSAVHGFARTLEETRVDHAVSADTDHTTNTPL